MRKNLLYENFGSHSKTLGCGRSNFPGILRTTITSRKYCRQVHPTRIFRQIQQICVIFIDFWRKDKTKSKKSPEWHKILGIWRNIDCESFLSSYAAHIFQYNPNEILNFSNHFSRLCDFSTIFGAGISQNLINRLSDVKISEFDAILIVKVFVLLFCVCYLIPLLGHAELFTSLHHF